MAGRNPSYRFTPKRAAALEMARRASARSRSKKAQQVRATKKAVKEGKSKITPWARFTRHSQSVGIHGRLPVIPGTDRRFVVGAHIRFEKTTRSTVVDAAIPRTTVRHGKAKSTLGQFKKEANLPRISRSRRGGRSGAV